MIRKYIISIGISIILLAQLASAQTVSPELIRLVVVPEVVDREDPFPYLFVVLTDNRGSPLIATRDINVGLVSSDSSIVEVQSSIVIPKGEYYAVGKVETRSAGTTDIKASYAGQRVSAEISVTEITSVVEDLSLSVRLAAPTMLTATSMPFSIFLSDNDGNPVAAPFDISINGNYDQNLINADIPTKISAGSAYAMGTIESLQRSGNAWIRLYSDDIAQQVTTSVRVIADKPRTLMLHVLPGNVTYFDRSFYLYVGLLDETEIPARAGEDITVRVFTNMTTNLVKADILREPLTMRIKKGDFGSFMSIPLEVRDQDIRETYVFSAAAEGLQPSQTHLKLVGLEKKIPPNIPIEPTLETIPKVGENSEFIATIQIRDVNGTLYAPPSSIQPEAISSNLDALRVSKVGFVGSSHSYALIHLKSAFKSDEVMLVGGMPGFGSTNSTVTVSTKQPSKTVIFSPVNNIQFNSANRFDLYVVLLDDADRIARAEQNMQFMLTPINNIKGIQSGHSFVHYDFSSTEVPPSGNVTVTALPVGVDSDLDLESNVTLEIKQDSVASIRLISPLRDMVGLKSREDIMIIQLVDSVGNPYRAPSDVSVRLSSSDPDIIGVDSTVNIRKGSSFALFSVYPLSSDGSTRITASANIFGTTSQTIRTVLAPLPLAITPSLATPETNREMTLTVESEPGARLSWTLPANVKVTKMDEQVAADGTAVLTFAPLSAQNVIIELEGTKSGYIANRVTYSSTVSNVIQKMNVQLVTYADTLLPDTVTSIGVKVTDDEGRALEGIKLEWDVTNAEVVGMSVMTDANGAGSVDVIAEGTADANIKVTASKSGFSSVTKNTSLAVDASVRTIQSDDSDMFMGVPIWYLYLGLMGGVGGIAAMRFMSSRKSEKNSVHA